MFKLTCYFILHLNQTPCHPNANYVYCCCCSFESLHIKIFICSVSYIACHLFSQCEPRIVSCFPLHMKRQPLQDLLFLCLAVHPSHSSSAIMISLCKCEVLHFVFNLSALALHFLEAPVFEFLFLIFTTEWIHINKAAEK